MQSIANTIVDMLEHRGVQALMYLDDIVIISPNREKGLTDFEAARNLLKDLGLPEAADKAQEPSTRVKWLGINIDTVEMSLSVPEEKLKYILVQVSKWSKARSMTKKQLQSILGQLLHIAKCVQPARLFVARLHEALRSIKGKYINVNASMRADFRWFVEFAQQWNGRAYIPDPEPVKDIYVDACLTGIGATDGRAAYAGQVAPLQDGANNITELEIINVVVAIHTLLSQEDRATHVRIHCDNMEAVQVLQSGRAGVDNLIADALSRAHISKHYNDLATSLIQTNRLNVITSCLHVFENITSPLLSRLGHRIVTGQGSRQTTIGSGTGDHGEPKIDRRPVHRIRQEGKVLPAPSDVPGRLRIHRVHGPVCTGPWDNQEQDFPYQIVPPPRPGGHAGDRPPASREGIGRNIQEQGVRATQEGPSPYGHAKVGHLHHSTNSHRLRNSRCSPHNVLWGATPVGNCAPDSEGIRPIPTPHQGGSDCQQRLYGAGHKVGKNNAKDWTTEGHYVTQGSRQTSVPSAPHGPTLRPHPHSLFYRPTAHVSQHRGPHTTVNNSVGVGCRSGNGGSGQNKTLTAQPQTGGSHSGSWCRMWRATNTETGRLGLYGI